MLRTLKKWWRYVGAKLGASFDERADPKIQLEQAITEARDQHQRLKEQAANVIAHQKQTEMQLTAKLDDLERLNANARQAVLMADEAQRAGDSQKAGEYTQAAESFANQIIAIESEIENLKSLHLQATEAAEQAKAAVQQNSTALQAKLAQKQKLLSQLDQAKMQEQMNSAMGSLSETVGQDVPTLDEVRRKIEERYAKAAGAGELQASSVEGKMLEVEQASMNMAAQSRLEQIRSEMGLGSTTTPAAETSPAVGQPEADTEGGTAAPSAG